MRSYKIRFSNFEASPRCNAQQNSTFRGAFPGPGSALMLLFSFNFHTNLHITTPVESFCPPKKTTSQCSLGLPLLAPVSIELIFIMPALVIVDQEPEPTGSCLCACVRVALTWSSSFRTRQHRTHLHNASARDHRTRIRTNGRVCVCVCACVRFSV